MLTTDNPTINTLLDHALQPDARRLLMIGTAMIATEPESIALLERRVSGLQRELDDCTKALAWSKLLVMNGAKVIEKE